MSFRGYRLLHEMGVKKPKNTPITEEALREMECLTYDAHAKPNAEWWIQVDDDCILSVGINKSNEPFVRLDINGEWILIPGCRTMQDLETLIRLLGGEQG